MFQHIAKLYIPFFFVVSVYYFWDLRQLKFHLKRVIVTPAVYLSLAPLNRSFRCRHWADVNLYTQLFSLAQIYVFGKQSDRHSYCTLLTHKDIFNTQKQGPHMPKARG